MVKPMVPKLGMVEGRNKRTNEVWEHRGQGRQMHLDMSAWLTSAGHRSMIVGESAGQLK
jgi:hypothetical protein